MAVSRWFAYALRLKSGAHDWNRTSDLLLTKEVLYRLSYVSKLFQQEGVAAFNGAGDGNRTRTISLEG
jgi:hypothetical protein